MVVVMVVVVMVVVPWHGRDSLVVNVLLGTAVVDVLAVVVAAMAVVTKIKKDLQCIAFL